jgi:hypothetical protein
MNGIDDLRTQLTLAVRLPDEVSPKPVAGHVIRQRALRARRVTIWSTSATALACLVLVGLVLNVGGLRPTWRTSSPASTISTSGLTTLAAPLEIRPVISESRTCPSPTGVTPDASGDTCFRLADPALVVTRVGRIEKVERPQFGSTDVRLTLTQQDSATWRALTTASVNQQLAFVIDGAVRWAPLITEPLPAHVITLGFTQDDGETAFALLNPRH